MKPLLLTSKACFLAVRHHKLLFTDYISRTQAEFTARQLPFDSIIIYRAGGNVSFEAVRFLMQNGVPIVHLSWDGSQVAVTIPPGPISGELRIAQYQAFLDKNRRNQLAKAFVQEKVGKSIDLLRFLKKRYPMVELSAVESVAQTSSPMGFEGKTLNRTGWSLRRSSRQLNPTSYGPVASRAPTTLVPAIR
jgi:CRISPR/Cas system-associated endonuclease Cas1